MRTKHRRCGALTFLHLVHCHSERRRMAFECSKWISMSFDRWSGHAAGTSNLRSLQRPSQHP